jgi:hypothetical protein
MKSDVIFWMSVVLCILSFLLFAGQVVVAALAAARRPAAPTGAGGATQQTINPLDAMKQMAELAQAFAKAGPMSTSAVLCAFFGAIALASSRVLA